MIAGRTESLGASHTSTLNAKMGLAISFVAGGNPEQAKRVLSTGPGARQLFTELIQRYTLQLGDDHEVVVDERHAFALAFTDIRGDDGSHEHGDDSCKPRQR